MRVALLLFIFFLQLHASYVIWQSDYEKAHKLAKELSKPMMILLIEQYDDAMKKLIVQSFMNQDYIDEVNKKYVAVLVVKDQKSSYPIENLFTTSYPALFFLDNNELFYCQPLFTNIDANSLRQHLKLCR